MKINPTNNLTRRRWIQQVLPLTLGPLLVPVGFANSATLGFPNSTPNLKLSLNAYSFNAPLMKQELSLHQLFEFCATAGFQAVDLTAYYLSGYPKVPEDRYLYEVKRDTHRHGLHISGTGVRNDFTHLPYDRRKQEVQLVKDWIVAASKLGAPVLRVFSGTQAVSAADRQRVWEWMIADFRECADFGANHGVIVALQNHNDFIQTADEVNQIMEEVASPWFGLVLDIGSYPQEEPYEGIAKNIQHAVNWQIKEQVNHFGEQRPVDLVKLMQILASSNYQGYLPIETLGPGDPFKKVRDFSEKVRGAMREQSLGD
ncbi:sugar phosphate isomerase/epimerase family protein [Lunatibacter salilacus]|uniref:sugar phosphate isomerase/epimerase family protein n=1 Tax=Lunatibacter salilacus TaxID=2483804 RepID=UPI00131C21AA|nr:sugar phosphate isomerase/epimerase family protein [Lunatibacter salilacus]